MKRSKIEWCDFSGGNLNFVRRGKDDCECSPGCDHCYARRIGERFGYLPDVTTFYPDKLAKLATQQFGYSQVLPTHPSPPLLFVCDTGDLFHPAVPFEVIRDAINMMVSRKDVTWLILTKRAQRMHDLFSRIVLPSWVWLGVTVCDDNERWKLDLLCDTPAGKRFVSYEPAIGPLDLRYHLCADYIKNKLTLGGYIDWVIAGCESGQGRRPADAAWFRSLRDQCVDNGVPFFLKQMDVDGQIVKMPELDGQVWRQFPE